MHRISSALIVFATAAVAEAGPREFVINNTSELRSWCQAESQAELIGRGSTPYNWTASYWNDGNVLNVKGSWRVNGADTDVTCRVAKGANNSYATLSISPAH